MSDVPKIDAPEAQQAPKDIQKKYKMWWPGAIGISNRDASHSGCRSMVVSAGNYAAASKAVNEFFEQNKGCLAVDIQPLPLDANNDASFHVLYTIYVDPERMEKMNKFYQKAEELLEAEEAEATKQAAMLELTREKMEKEKKEREEKERKENNRLIELGRVHERNCGKKKK